MLAVRCHGARVFLWGQTPCEAHHAPAITHQDPEAQRGGEWSPGHTARSRDPKRDVWGGGSGRRILSQSLPSDWGRLPLLPSRVSARILPGTGSSLLLKQPVALLDASQKGLWSGRRVEGPGFGGFGLLSGAVTSFPSRHKGEVTSWVSGRTGLGRICPAPGWFWGLSVDQPGEGSLRLPSCSVGRRYEDTGDQHWLSRGCPGYALLTWVSVSISMHQSTSLCPRAWEPGHRADLGLSP